jgi:molybdopterin converting factor small subunit
VEIEVRLFANLADYLPAGARGGATRLTLAEGATVEEVMRRLRVPEELPRLLFVNGRDARPEQVLQAGDVLSVFPPLAGGAARPA